MIEEFAVAALYLVPVAVAALIAYFVTREPADEPDTDQTAGRVIGRPGQPQVRQHPLAPARPAVTAPAPPRPRDPWYDLYESESLRRVAGANGVVGSTAEAVPTHGTLLNAALSAHFDAVSRASDRRTGGRALGSGLARSAFSSHLPLRSVSVRRPTRHSRRATHRCYKQAG